MWILSKMTFSKWDFFCINWRFYPSVSSAFFHIFWGSGIQVINAICRIEGMSYPLYLWSYEYYESILMYYYSIWSARSLTSSWTSSIFTSRTSFWEVVSCATERKWCITTVTVLRSGAIYPTLCAPYFRLSLGMPL